MTRWKYTPLILSIITAPVMMVILGFAIHDMAKSALVSALITMPLISGARCVVLWGVMLTFD